VRPEVTFLDVLRWEDDDQDLGPRWNQDQDLMVASPTPTLVGPIH